MLPGGQAVLFTIWPLAGDAEAAQIAVFDRESGTYEIVLRGGTHARYVSSGHLLYAAADTLRAVTFDPVTFDVRGTPVPVVPDVLTTTGVTSSGGVQAVVATDGTLIYVRGVNPGSARRTPVWIDRQGRESALVAPARAYVSPRISPTGGHIVYAAEADLWIWDAARLTFTRLTFDPALDAWPVWTPDGRRVIFSSERDGGRNLWWQSADGSGGIERLTRSLNPQNPTSVSPDGNRVVFTEAGKPTAEDVMQVELSGNHEVTALVETPFAERNGVISPDGRWLAYEATEGGPNEIHVRPYPNVGDGRWQVSSGGGTRPLWSRDGRELFYVTGTGAIMGVRVDGGKAWSATPAVNIIGSGYMTNLQGFLGRTYDVSPDGQRFLVLKSTADVDARPPELVVIQHFDEELKRLVPVE
jgi:serine/threonine-protein kinase